MADTNAEDSIPMADHPVIGGLAVLCHKVFVKPAIWFRKNVVEANQGETEPYYHRRFNRVPQIDECYQDDVVCRAEAQEQFLRDKTVEMEIMAILRHRFDDCVFYEKGTGPTAWQPAQMGAVVPNTNSDGSPHMCQKILDAYEKASENYFIKYGELGKYPRVEDAYMKQKHRLMWERRHGKIGTGMKKDEPAESAASDE